MPTPDRYRTRPEQVIARQFNGWGDAIAIMRGLASRCYYVGAGFEHDLRRSDEIDHDGSPRPDALAFLVLESCEAGPAWLRVNPGSWVVSTAAGPRVVDRESFEAQYELDPTGYASSTPGGRAIVDRPQA